MADERSNVLVSVVMPCCGQLEHTRLSLPRVLGHSRQPIELLLIDAGSFDGTREYLAGVKAAAPVRVEVFRNPQDSAFATMVEQALDKAQGSFVAWVNNDVLVTEFWLQQLLGLVTANEKIGAAGPMANAAPEAQRVAQIPYRLARHKGQFEAVEDGLDVGEVDGFARSFREANRGQWAPAERLGGFCWLARRAVINSLEYVLRRENQEIGLGMHGLRARTGGVSLACCRDLFVHNLASHSRQA